MYMDNLETIKTQILNWVSDNFGNSFKFRKYQLESIMFVIKSIITDDRETSIIEAPTGSGKSLISIIAAGVLSKYYNLKSYILCSDLFLWQQYADIIDNYKLKNYGYLKGSIGNYTCFMNQQDLSNGRCRLMKISYAQLKDKNWRERNFFNCVDTCVYMQQRFKAENANVTLLTYQLWLHFMNLVNNESNESNQSFPKRPVIFCDECHNIPDIIQQFCSPSINVVKDKTKLIDILKYAENHDIRISTNIKVFSEFKNVNFLKNSIDYVEKSKFKRNTITAIRDSLFKDIFNIDKISNILDNVYAGFNIYLEDNKQILEILTYYCEVILNLFDIIISEIEKDIKNSNVDNLDDEDKSILKRISWFNVYKNTFKAYLSNISSTDYNYLIIEHIINEDKNDIIYQFNCAKEDYLCNGYLLKHAKHKIMLSATVGSHHAFDTNIGIKYTEQKESYLSKIPTTFNYNNSPIYYIPTYKMNYYNKNTDFPKIIELCVKILNATNKRGIIHTGSYENARYFYDNVPKEIKKRLFLYGTSKQKEEIIPDFKNRTDGVLIGPTLTEGIDLPDDYCRFIIIVKIPYPNITSKIVKKKIELFPEWYNNITSNIIIQSIGRGIRNENDYCVTYILDGCFGNLYQQTKEQYPKYIQDRIKIIYK